MDDLAIPEPSGWEDSLTGLEGPDFWQRVLVAEVARALRYNRNLTVVVAELEGVLTMAETWGTDVGRHSSARRPSACAACRAHRTTAPGSGSTRFGVILTETDEIAAINYVERVREAGPRSMPRGGENLRFSFGWASPKPGEPADGVVRRADSRLVAELLG